ncbi:hypothetical protein CS063_07785 [Sporanaerobium hydrogeniformans]|uniref:Uncharacterized protein n=1 Tax=Sporanaerobium hydrogeniformans TaxID=3072179 RepID=A0AC61DDR0_9FIRM|nr:hypothetical protein [Sporanaerobium hydrogeniformans]PHV70913.1 hypothetical protein CS063_07785 [Sporanaerobium hydrogeniformans]
MNLSTHPAFSHVDPNFLQTLQKTIDHTSGKSELEMLGTMMAISNEAKKKNISFTPEMQTALLDYLKSHLPVAKRKQFDAFLSMFLSKMNTQ